MLFLTVFIFLSGRDLPYYLSLKDLEYLLDGRGQAGITALGLLCLPFTGAIYLPCLITGIATLISNDLNLDISIEKFSAKAGQPV